MDFRSKILSREKELESRASGIARSVIATLNGREDDLAKEIRARVGWIAERGYDSSPLSLKRLEVGLVSIGDVLAESYKDAGRDLRARLQQTGLQEIERQRELLAITGRDIKTPDTSAVKAILGEQSFRGGRLTDWLGKLLDSSTFRVSGAIRQGLAAGLLVDGIVRAVLGTKGKQWRDGVMEPGRNDMAKLVPSAVNHVTRKAREETWQLNSGIVEALEWVAVVDGAKCPLDPSCQDRAGLLYAVDTHEPIDHSIPWLEGPGLAHWNCFPGDVLVSFGGPLQAVTSRHYDGDLVIVRTSGGDLLPCTPNHPVLTDRGWVPAGLLNVGSNVITDRRRQGRGAIDRDAQDAPARIQDVAEAFLNNPQVTAVPMPVSAEDFHGDGAGSEVATVGANGLLWNCLYSALRQHVSEPNFVAGYANQSGLPGQRTLAALLHATRSSANGGMGSGNEGHSLLRSTAGHTRRLLLLAIAMQAVALQHGAHPLPGRSDEQGDAGSPDAGLEQPDGFGVVEVGGIDRHSFSGHVYNLQTESERYSANGIVVHNCRCVSVPVIREMEEAA